MSSRLLGIDYGKKRVGVAFSDESGKVAFPLKVLANDENLLAAVLALAKEKTAQTIVVGESKDYEGKPNAIFNDSQIFAESLKQSGLNIVFEPEFMTSANAERFQGKNEHLDASAAALILQSYLDRQIK